MKSWVIAAGALLSAVAAKGEAPSKWLVHALPGGAELLYQPLAVTLSDYPKKARKAGDEGTSLLSLRVDISGRLKDCRTVRSSGSPLLDVKACQLYRKRGRFELRGTSEAVTVEAPVKWVLVD